MILKILTIVFVILVLAKYVFNAKIHERYIFGVAALLAIFSNFGKQHSAIEMFDGSSVAFDKEAFENLNRIVNEIAGDGRLTVPGNLIVKGTAKFEKNCTLDKKLTVKDTSTFEKDCTLKKKLTVKDTSTFEKDCTLKKKLDVEGNSTFNGNCTIKGNKNMIVEGSGSVKINNQSMTGSSSNGIVGPKFLADSFQCTGNRTYIDKTNGIRTETIDIDTLKGHAYGESRFRVTSTPQFEAVDDIYMTFADVAGTRGVKFMRENSKLVGNFPGQGARRDLAVL